MFTFFLNNRGNNSIHVRSNIKNYQYDENNDEQKKTANNLYSYKHKAIENVYEKLIKIISKRTFKYRRLSGMFI